MSEGLIREYLEGKKKKVVISSNVILSRVLSKFLLSVIFFMLSVILIRNSENIKKFYTEEIFTKQVSFTKFNAIYNKYFGDVIPTYNVPTENVFHDTLDYSHMEPYLNGSKLSVSTNYMVPVIKSGIIVFLGEKEYLGNTCIIQGVDGVDIWYSNIDTSNLNLYDYMEEGKFLANSLSDFIYLTLDKEGNYISYETYQT